MQIVTLYAVTALIFLAADAVMLRTVMKPLFTKHLGDAVLDSPRLGANDDPLPEDYSPLGASPDVGKVVELLFVGLPVEDDVGTESDHLTNLFEATDGGGIAQLHALEDAANPWVEEQSPTRAFPRTLRHAIGADVDGDGFESQRPRKR